MTNQGAKTSSLNCGGSYTIPAGYDNGPGKITVNSLASQTSATAAAAQILSGYTAWANGNKLTGTTSGASTSASISGGGGVISGASVSISGSKLTIKGSAIAKGNFALIVTLP